MIANNILKSSRKFMASSLGAINNRSMSIDGVNININFFFVKF